MCCFYLSICTDAAAFNKKLPLGAKIKKTIQDRVYKFYYKELTNFQWNKNIGIFSKLFKTVNLSHT